jgi:uncharacterized repeat protein (TIGR03803 family)
MRKQEYIRNWMSKLNCGTSHAVVSLACVMILAIALTPSANAQTYSVVYSFTGSTDGAYPALTMILDSAGNLYGGTSESGQLLCTALCGNFYKLDPSTGNLTTLATSNSGAEGYGPSALVFDKSGKLFGAMGFGGPGLYGYLFELNPNGKGKVLHDFPANPGDGEIPGNLLFDPAGNLYGVTPQGGSTADCPPYGCGTVFRFTPSGKESLIDFTAAAWSPDSLVLSDSGVFYGTTYLGGTTGCDGTGCGTVFKIDKTGKMTTIYKFQGGMDASLPMGPLALDKAGNLYGTSWEGGNPGICVPGGCGTVYKIDPSGKETVLHRFSVSDGALPYSGITLDAAGNLYGTTFSGGPNPNCEGSGCGTVFKMDPSGNETVLYKFGDGTDGGFPVSGVVFDKAGNLYGTAFYGGYIGGDVCYPIGCGVVFKITQ